MKRIVSIFLTAVMVLNMVPSSIISAFAVTSYTQEYFEQCFDSACTHASCQQIEVIGGKTIVDAGEDTTTEYKDNDDVTITKFVEPVEKTTEDSDGDIENYFDITLKVTSPPHVQDHKNSVVIVMDISNTMNYNHEGSLVNEFSADYKYAAGGEKSSSRIYQAKQAAKTFVDEWYAAGILKDHHKLGIVTFATDAKTVQPLKSMTELSADQVKTNINNIVPTRSTMEDAKYTNIEGGLKLAYNMLAADTDAHNKYIILLTDGFPTTYINTTAGNSGSTSAISGWSPVMYNRAKSGKNDIYKWNGDNKTNVRDYSFYNDVIAGDYGAVGADGVEGFFYDTVKRSVDTWGTDYSDLGAKKAEAMAKTIKDAGITLFGIGLDIGSMSVRGYRKSFENRVFNTIDYHGSATNIRYVIGSDSDPDASEAGTYGDWLKYDISGGNIAGLESGQYYYQANSQESLTNAYKGILSAIQSISTAPFRDGQVVDIMGEDVEFLGFYKNGGLVSNTGATGEFVPVSTHSSLAGSEETALINGGENTVSYNAAERKITWNVTKSGWFKEDYQAPATGNATARNVYSMILKYRVRLKNEKDGFAFADIDSTTNDGVAESVTNEKAYFRFHTWSAGHEEIPEEDAPHFPQPEVEGYKGSLQLYKYHTVDGGQTAPLEGAEFTLTHKDNCSVCKAGGGSVSFSSTAVSGTDGKVNFTAIPSGHEYTLKETQAPRGYQLSQRVFDVAVHYGVVTVKENSTEVTDIEIENKKFVPVDVVLTAEKLMNGSHPAANAFTFELSGEGIATQTETNGGNGLVIFDEITYNRTGTYTYKIKEVPGTDSEIFYDRNEYTVTVTVGTNDAGTELVVKKVENTAGGVTGDGPYNVAVFRNVSREKGDASFGFNVTKIYSGILEDANTIFSFEAKDNSGAVVATAEIPASILNSGTASADMIFTGGANKLVLPVNPEDLDENGKLVKEYSIIEKTGTDADTIYDNTVYTAKVTITASNTENGKYTASVEYIKNNTIASTDTAEFTNSRKDKTVDISIPVKKTLQGYEGQTPAPKLSDYQFFYELEAFNRAAKSVMHIPAVLTSTATEANTETLAFNYLNTQNGLMYNKAGVYEYNLTETTGTEDHIYYDRTVYRVVVTVTGTQDGYAATARYYTVASENTPTSQGVALGAGKTPEFVNSVTKPAEVRFHAEKILMDGQTRVLLSGGDFNFTLSGIDDGAKNIIRENTANNEETITVSNDRNGTVAFPAFIFYDQCGKPDGHVHEFLIKETIGSSVAGGKYNDADDVIMDPTEWKVVVTVNKLQLNSENVQYQWSATDTYWYRNASTGNNWTQYKDGDTPLEYAAFTNTVRQPVEAQLNAKKTLEGGTLTGGEFTFELYDIQGTLLATATNDSAGNVVFNTASLTAGNKKALTFDKAGTYNFVIKEKVNSADTSYVYDTTQWTAEIAVEADSTTGAYKVASVTYSNGTSTNRTAAQFTNTDRGPATVELAVRKLLANADTTNEQFTFELYMADANGNKGAKISELSVTGKGDAKFTTDKLSETYKGALTFDDADNHYFVISEKATSSNPDIVYDTAEYFVTVDLGTGTVNGKPVYVVEKITYMNKASNTASADGAVFTNGIRQDVAVVLNATKTMDGKTPEDVYTFELYGATAGGTIDETKVLATANNNGSDIVFNDIPELKFTEPGTHTFFIKEKAGNVNSTVYDTAVYKAVVTVTKGTDNDLYKYVTDVKYYNEAGSEVNAEDVVFENATRKPAEITLQAKKVLKDSEGKPQQLRSGVYRFELIHNGKRIGTASNDASGQISFTKNSLTTEYKSELTFKATGEFTFLIKEIPDASITDVVFSTEEYKAVVTVTKGTGADADKFTADVKYYNAAGQEVPAAEIVFNNTVREPVPVEIPVEKVFRDEDGNAVPIPAGEKFTFRLEGVSANAYGVEKVLTIDSSSQNPKFTLEEHRVGTYEYKVTEIKGENADIAYDTTVYNVVVKVTPDNNDSYTVSYEYSVNGTPDANVNKATFVNQAKKPISVTLEAIKTLDGGDPGDKVFDFELYAADGTTLIGKTSNNGGSIIFTEDELLDNHKGALTFDKAGTYSFKMKEATDHAGHNPDIIHSDKVIDVKVVVKEAGTTFTAEVTYDGTRPGYFMNITKDKTKANIQVKKSMLDAAGEPIDTDEVFRFTMKLLNSTVSDYTYIARTHEIKGNGTADFGVSGLTAGKYEFLIIEEHGNNPDVDYDDTEQRVIVYVEFDGEDGYIVSYNYGKNADGTDKKYVEFTNRVKTPTSAEINVEKVLQGVDGKSMDFGENEFKFELRNKAGTPAYNQTVTVNKNNETGTFTVSGLKAGTYEYLLTEQSGTNNDILYDNKQYNITVTVSDTAQDVDGYDVAVDYGTAGAEKAVFTNKERVPASAKIEVSKLMQNAQGAAVDRVEDFKFIMTNVNGTPAYNETATISKTAQENTAEFVLTNLTAGRYIYSLTEVKGTNPDVIYDTNVYYAVVNVIPHATENRYVVDVDYYNSRQRLIEEVEFVNKLKKAIDVEIPVSKAMLDTQGVTIPNVEDFTFTMTNLADSSNVATKTIAAGAKNGTAVFELTGLTAGIYNYTITENAGTNDDVVYDAQVYNVTVEVTADGDGYKAEVSYTVGNTEKTNVEFINKVRKPVDVQLEATKTLDGGKPANGQFTFQLYKESTGNTTLDTGNTSDALIATVENDADGKVVFNNSTIDRVFGALFTYSDVTPTNAPHIFYIKEICTDETYVTDESIFKAEITVTKGTDENADSYVAAVTYTDITATPATAQQTAEFENTTRTPVKAGFKVNKVLKTADGNATVDAAEWPVNFTFTLKAENELAKEILATDVAKTTAANSANVEFDNLEFRKAGIYLFTVQESGYDATDKADDGIIFDTTERKVEIEVAGGEGNDINKLIVKSIKVDNIEQTNNKVFADITVTNRLRKAADFTPVAWKTLEGARPASGRFQFRLLDKDGNVLETVYNGAAGKVTFSTLNFDETGTYEYQIAEIAGTERKIIYDRSVFKLTINVSADETKEEEFQITYTYEDSSGSDYKDTEPLFKNGREKSPPPPDTSDNTNIALYMGLGVFSVLMVIVLLAMKKKYKEK